MKTLITFLTIILIFGSWTQEIKGLNTKRIGFNVLVDGINRDSIQYGSDTCANTKKVEICKGQGITLIGHGAENYCWTSGIANGIEFIPMNSQDYHLITENVHGELVKLTAKVKVNEVPDVDFLISDLSLTTKKSTTGFRNLTHGADVYSWSFGDGSIESYEFEPKHTFPIMKSGEYEVTLQGTSNFGCIGERTKYVHVLDDYSFELPHEFVIDTLRLNQYLLPVMDGFKARGYSMTIYNIKGELIFESDDATFGWNGESSLDGSVRVNEDYFWRVEVHFKTSNDSKLFMGYITLRSK